LDQIGKPTRWNQELITAIKCEYGTYLGPKTSSDSRAKGFEFDGLYPIKGTFTYQALSTDCQKAIKDKRRDWNGIKFSEYESDDPNLVDEIVKRYIRLDHDDNVISLEDIMLILSDGKVPKGSKVDGNIYQKLNGHVTTEIELGKYKGSKDRQRAISSVLSGTVLPDALKTGEKFNEANLAKVLMEGKHYSYEDQVVFDSFKIMTEQTSSCPHYNQMWFTRHLCCKQSNVLEYEIRKMPCFLHSLSADEVDGPPTCKASLASGDFGVTEENSGSLRLPGIPTLAARCYQAAANKIKRGETDPISSYITSTAQVVQRKLGGINPAVMATLSAIWGGIEGIPSRTIEAVRGKSESDGISFALSSKNNLSDSKGSNGNKSKKSPKGTNPKATTKATGTKPNKKPPNKDIDYKHKDPKVLHKVRSAFGAKGFWSILEVIKGELGEGKFPIDKLSEHFHSGKLKKGHKSDALKLRLN